MCRECRALSARRYNGPTLREAVDRGLVKRRLAALEAGEEVVTRCEDVGGEVRVGVGEAGVGEFVFVEDGDGPVGRGDDVDEEVVPDQS